MPNIDNKSLQHNDNLEPDLFGPAAPAKTLPTRSVTRENWTTELATVACPFCKAIGLYITFARGPHIGIACTSCNRENPLRSLGIQWLPGAR